MTEKEIDKLLRFEKESFPRLLRKYRLAKEATQVELGHFFGVSSWSIQRYEYGTRMPGSGTMTRIKLWIRNDLSAHCD